MNRSAIASSSAGTKAAALPNDVSPKSALKTTARMIAAGTMPIRPIALNDRFSTTSLWTGWIGRISIGEKNPVWIRQPNSHMCQTKVRWLTTISTTK